MQTTQPTVAAQSPLLTKTWYANYVLGALTVCYVLNTMDRSQILAASLQAIKKEFAASDFQMGVLTGIPFALFYSFMGIPIAAMADRSSRRNVLALAVASWSAMTAIFGMSVNYAMLFVGACRHGGRRGGRQPAVALAHLRLLSEEPAGHRLLDLRPGRADRHLARRRTRRLGQPDHRVAHDVHPRRRARDRHCPDPVADGEGAATGNVRRRLARAAERAPVPGMFDVLRTLWQKKSFRHLTLAAALHSVVWYASGAFNNAFLQRSHQMSVSEAGYWIAVLSAMAGFGTFFGGFAADRLSTRFKDRRWYVWVPGIATLLCVPFQFLAYLSADRAVVLPSFVGLMFMAAVFFGPSFAMTQALATLRMRSVATSLLLFIQTLIGNGLGPSVTGFISDRLAPSFQQDSLRYALVIIGVVNVWAALHYLLSSRTVRQDLEATEKLATA